MIEYIKGDLLKTDAKIIVHGCNARGVMGSGVALAIKNKWPWAYETYREAYETRQDPRWDGDMLLPLGDIYPAANVFDGKVVVNAITQRNYGRDGKKYASYDAIDECMRKIATKFSTPKGPATNPVIAMPKIGCGLGGGVWEIVQPIIYFHLQDFHVKVYEL
jgi:O-acetyl-ADP-ribose deacetylase (regulator of RNase III)